MLRLLLGRIIPKNARYFFCTVESIPENTNFEFVAIDEVQMAWTMIEDIYLQKRF